MSLDPTGIGQVASAGEGVINTIANVIFRFFPDKQKAAEAAQALSLEVLQQQGQMNHDQSVTNQVEAGNANLFVSGGRPFLMWVCGAAFAWAFVLGPIFYSIVKLWKVDYVPPVFDSGSLTALTLGMLGLAGARTYEKIQGIEPPSTPIINTTRTITSVDGNPVRVLPAKPV